MPLIPVGNLEDPRLDVYRNLPGRRNERQTGVFVTEGDKVTERMLAAGWDVVSLLVEPRYAEAFALKAPAETPILVASRELLTETVGFHFARGVLGCGRRPLRRTWQQAAGVRSESHIFVVLPDIQDPTNLATIIRTSAALGMAGVVVGPEAADVWSRRVVRVSMGAVFSIPIIECDSIDTLLTEWQAEPDFTTIATVLDEKAIPIEELRVPKRGAIFIGNEGHGLSDEIVLRCQAKTTIAMAAGVDSLNASVAAGIFLYRLAASGSLPSG
jgi:tRNA G18 (ribose-2'-O)-methylase SpoU